MWRAEGRNQNARIRWRLVVRAFLVSLGLTGLVLACKRHSPAPPVAAALDGGGAPALTSSDAGVSAESPPPREDAGLPPETQLPASQSEELTVRARHLVEAIAQDNPDLGVDILFPRDGFIAAKDARDAGKTWDNRLVPSFRRHIHKVHKALGAKERIEFVSFELGRQVNQVAVRRGEWKLPLWRVHHAKIRVRVDGHDRTVDLAELVSWRGAWYVTRLR